MIYAISNEKGGQAKTTTTAALAEGTAYRGHSVLAIDGDPQGALTYELTGTDPGGPGLYEVMVGGYTVNAAIHRTRNAGVDILIASDKLAGLDKEIPGNIYALRHALRKVRTYEYVFIDCPAIVNLMQLNAIMCADKLIIPATPDAYSVRSIQHTISVMEDAQNAGSNIELAGILFTRVRKRQLVDNAIMNAARDCFPDKVFHTDITERAAVRGLSITNQSIYNRGGATRAEYEAVLDELKIMRGAKKP